MTKPRATTLCMLLCLGLLAAGPTTARATGGGDAPGQLFQPVTGQREMEQQPAAPPAGRHIVRRRFASVNFAAVTSGQPVVLNLFDGVSVTIDGSKIQQRKGVYTYSDRLPAQRWGDIIFAAVDGTVRATIHLDDRVFEVNPTPNGGAVIDEIDPSKLPMDPPITPLPPGKAGTESHPRNGSHPRIAAAAEATPVITVLALFPSSSMPCMLGMLQEQATSFELSLDAALRFFQGQMGTASVTATCVDYTPKGGDLEADLEWVASDPTVAGLRDQNRADFVTLIDVIAPDSVCGRAYYNPTLARSLGFSVVIWSCATSNYTLAHEIGHNMGMHHDRATDNDWTSPDCNFGWCNSKMATIMAKPEACPGSVRVGVYSTPFTAKLGPLTLGPWGVPCDNPPAFNIYSRANNQQTLLSALPIVSSWY